MKIYILRKKKGVNELNKMFPLISPPNTHPPKKLSIICIFFFVPFVFVEGGSGYMKFMSSRFSHGARHKHVLQQHIFFFLKLNNKK